MATIDTSGIDVLYPVAGVDNDSQGFRDNFAAIKAALESAVGITTTQSLTNKTLVAPTLTNPTVSGSLSVDASGNISFEGSTADNYETVLSAADPTQDRVIILPDADGTVVLADSDGAIGYKSAQHGTVTQSTSKSAGVSLSKVSGSITMHNSALAAGSAVSFTLTNTVIEPTDVVLVSIKSGATGGAYSVIADEVNSGDCRISLTNVSSSSLSEAVVLNFVVFKGAAS